MKTLKQRQTLAVCAFLVAYLFCWWLTWAYAGQTVQKQAIADMELPGGGDGFSEVGHAVALHNKEFGKVFYCERTTLAPFIIHVKYGWGSGSLYGNGGSALYFWFFGKCQRVRELDQWSQ